MILLLFADDMVILVTNSSDLQTSLNKLYEYCYTCEIQVNVDKSKCMVFSGEACEIKKFGSTVKIHVFLKM
jgi:hypothetical protein